ncbi:MAG TPA: thiamine phosphate synthase, partial [Elusimicrobiota bacterium]|nr:thiamine phosphate synthase [Elusimicrobiota bacterium]
AQALRKDAGRLDFLIGRSTHSLVQAQDAERDGADYIAIGPVFQTPTKPTYEPVGLELLRRVTSLVRTPHVVIGGIDSTNVAQVLAAGARRVAVVRAVCGKRDVREAARHLKQMMEQQEGVRA